MKLPVVLALLLLSSALPTESAGCTGVQVGVKFNNTDWSQTQHQLSSLSADHCCQQCAASPGCTFWNFLNDSLEFQYTNYYRGFCYLLNSSANPIPAPQFTSGGFVGTRPGESAMANGGPCLPATKQECGVGSPPYLNGTHVFCAEACHWNATPYALADGFCETRIPAGYAMPQNQSLQELVGPQTPLRSNLKISFYGDSITFLNIYERVIADAIAHGAGTKGLVNITLIDQGCNGGTVTDLVRGYGPWGHLDPHQPQTNITFEQTVARDKPDIVAVQIGVNDVWQQPKRGENVSVYANVLQNQIVKVAKQLGAAVYLVSISEIGEKTDISINGRNPGKHDEIQAYVDAAVAVGKAEDVYVVDVFAKDLACTATPRKFLRLCVGTVASRRPHHAERVCVLIVLLRLPTLHSPLIACLCADCVCARVCVAVKMTRRTTVSI